MAAYAGRFNLKTQTSQKRSRTPVQEAAASRIAEPGGNRPEAVARRQWRAAIEDSPRAAAQAQWRPLIDQSPRQVAQRQRMEGLFGQTVPRHAGPAGDALRRPTEPATRQRPVMNGAARVVQRMTYVLPVETGLWKDANERNANRADAVRAGHTPICDTPRELKNIAQDEYNPETRELHVYAHGNQMQIGKYSAGEFLAHLKDAGVNTPERRTNAIVLHSCMSAAPHPNNPRQPPIAEQIHSLIWSDWTPRTKHAKQVLVVGYHSRAFTDRLGQTRVLNPAFWDDIDKYEKLFRKARAKQTSPERVGLIEEKYLLSAEESRKVYEKKKLGARSRHGTREPFSFDTGSVDHWDLPKKEAARPLRQALEEDGK